MCLALFLIIFVLKRTCSCNGSDVDQFPVLLKMLLQMFHQNFSLVFIIILKFKFSPAKGLEIILKYTTKLKIFVNTYNSRSLHNGLYLSLPDYIRYKGMERSVRRVSQQIKGTLVGLRIKVSSRKVMISIDFLLMIAHSLLMLKV